MQILYNVFCKGSFLQKGKTNRGMPYCNIAFTFIFLCVRWQLAQPAFRQIWFSQRHIKWDHYKITVQNVTVHLTNSFWVTVCLFYCFQCWNYVFQCAYLLFCWRMLQYWTRNSLGVILYTLQSQPSSSKSCIGNVLCWLTSFAESIAVVSP